MWALTTASPSCDQSDGYLHEKLESTCKREVIDFDSIRDTVCSCIVGRIDEKFDADQIPEEISGIPDQGATLDQAELLVGWLRNQEEAGDLRLPFSDLADVIEEVETFAEGRDTELVLARCWLTTTPTRLTTAT